MLSLDRDILGADYLDTMREIVEKQAESATLEDIARHDKNFALLAFSASGNPRVLLKTLTRAPRVTAAQTNEVVREYYRSELWSEHSTLPEKYVGHKHLIDWGRQFIEGIVLPDLQKKNVQYLEQEHKSTCFFWIHRDAPQPVKEALKLLAYSGIVTQHASGIRATRSEVGTRYAVNLGALIAQEGSPGSAGPAYSARSDAEADERIRCKPPCVSESSGSGAELRRANSWRRTATATRQTVACSRRNLLAAYQVTGAWFRYGR